MLLRFVLLLFIISVSFQPLANQVNLVLKETWGDLHYGMMVSDGNYLYVASDGVLVLDMSNPELAVEKTKIAIPIHDEIRAIEKLKKIDDYLYVMTGKQFYIYDVSDVNTPLLKTTIDYTGGNYWSDFVIKENTLFIVGQDNITLNVYDITESTNPVLERSVPQKVMYSTDGIKLALTNDHLVLCYLEEVKLLSLAADNYLSELYSDTQQSFVRSEIPVLGDVAYLAHQDSLIVYDFANAEQVTKSSIELIDTSYKNMLISGSNLYVKGSQIQKFDLTSPKEPSLLATYSQSYHIYSYMTAIADNLVLSSSEEIITLSNSTKISEYSKSVYVNDLAMSNSVLASASNKSLRLFNLLSNEFEDVYESESSYRYSVQLNNNYMYTDNSLIYSLHDIENINLVGSFYHDEGLGNIGQITIDDNKLISRSSSKVTSFDLSKAIAPIELNEIDINTLTAGVTNNSNGMAVKDNHYFVSTDNGLYHFFQDENANLQVVGQLGKEGRLTETIIVNNYLYALSSYGVDIWNISDLDNPILATDLHTQAFNIKGMSAYQDWLFLPSSNEGISVVDIKNPEQAYVIENHHEESIYHPYEGVIDDNQLIVADWGQLKRFEINVAPVITTETLTTNEDTVLIQQIDFINLEQDDLSFEVITESTNGIISVNESGEINYLPNENFNGADSFVIKVVDQHGGDNEKTITIDIVAINDSPTVAENTLELLEDSLLSTSVLASDVEGDPLEYIVTTGPTSGQLSLNADGSFDYQPDENFFGTDSFSYTVSDNLSSPVSGSVTLVITAVNDSPTLVVEHLLLEEDTSVSGQSNASDIENDELTYSISTVANNGNVTIDDEGVYNYQANENYNGNDSFVITVTDGVSVVNQVVEVEISSVNDAPIAQDNLISGLSGSTIEGQVLANDVDGDELIFTVVNDVINGNLTLSEKGRFSYSPNLDYVGIDSFTFSVSDTSGAISEADVKITVNAKPEVIKDEGGSSGGALSMFFIGLLLLTLINRIRIVGRYT